MAEEKNIIEALLEIKEAVGYVGKDGYNEQQKFNFRGIDAVVSAVAGPMIRAGVVVSPKVLAIQTDAVVYGSRATAGFRTIVTVDYCFSTGAGQEVHAVVCGEAIDSGDKSTAKAFSVAFRTALLQALTLPTDEPDPDSYTYEDTRKEQGPTIHEKVAKALGEYTDLLPQDKKAVVESIIGEYTRFGDIPEEDMHRVMDNMEEAVQRVRARKVQEAQKAESESHEG